MRSMQWLCIYMYRYADWIKATRGYVFPCRALLGYMALLAWAVVTMFGQCCSTWNVKPALYRRCYQVSCKLACSYVQINMNVYNIVKRPSIDTKTLSPCWINVGPPSTLNQHNAQRLISVPRKNDTLTNSALMTVHRRPRWTDIKPA